MQLPPGGWVRAVRPNGYWTHLYGKTGIPKRGAAGGGGVLSTKDPFVAGGRLLATDVCAEGRREAKTCSGRPLAPDSQASLIVAAWPDGRSRAP